MWTTQAFDPAAGELLLWPDTTAAFSADRKEGIAAFNEKRKPHWPGN